MKTVFVNGKPVNMPDAASYAEAIDASGAFAGRRLIAVKVGGSVLALNDVAGDGMDVVPLDLTDEEARRVYERSLRFVFLLAIKQLYPTSKVRMENSMGGGIYCTVAGAQLNTLAVRRIELRMRELVAQDIPFARVTMPRSEALAYFESMGWHDKTALLRYRAPASSGATDIITLYDCAGFREYFYGAMLPSTGYADVFALHFQLPGILLMLPDKDDLSRPAPFQERPKLSRVLAESARNAELFGCANVANLNGMVVNGGIREFIRVNEALQSKWISNIADMFVESGARVMLIAGPSSSGKTTFKNRMYIDLRVLGLRPVCISLDDYYLDRDKIAPEPNGEIDLEKLEALDVPFFNEQLVAMLQGEPVELPSFNFATGKREMSGRTVRLEPGQPIVIEGIHGLNERLTRDIPRDAKFKVYISALTQLNLDDHNRIRTTDARLLRRLVRDAQFRGATAEHTFSMWPSVVRGEELNIFKYQEQADVMFNSSLMYEMCILKDFACPILRTVTADNPFYTKTQRLLQFLDYFVSAYVEDEIPQNSILREFIGGSCFYRDSI